MVDIIDESIKNKRVAEILTLFIFWPIYGVHHYNYYDLFEANSIKLQNRASDIVKNIQFNPDTSNNSLFQAIEYYRKKDGNLANNTPTGFL